MGEHINAFPGYEFVYDDKDKKWHNMYRGVDLGMGGWVYTKPGIYTNVALLDVSSLHPSSIIALNKLGEYTQRYADLKQARVYIKHKDFESAAKLFDGKLAKYLQDRNSAKSLSSALKLPLNAFFGQSFATYDNPARDSRDKNNIIALRGSLFMKTLFDEVEKRGFNIIHVKTDSVKIPNATLEIVQFVQEFARKYDYEMEHEATFDRICLIDKAQYIAALMPPEKCMELYGYVPGDNADQYEEKSHPWTATGDKFKRPYIFKTMFTGEPLTFDDKCETNSVKNAAIYLDMNEGMEDVTVPEKEMTKREWNEKHPNDPQKLNPIYDGVSNEDLKKEIAKGHNYIFVGRVGRFLPIKSGYGAGLQMSYRDGKYGAVNGSKEHRWLEAEIVRDQHHEDLIDNSYYDEQVSEAIKAIEKFGSYEDFIDLSKPYPYPSTPSTSQSDDDQPPFDIVPCSDSKRSSCVECPKRDELNCKLGYSLENYIS